MKTIKLLLVLLLSILMQLVFIAPRIVIATIDFTSAVLSIVRDTLSFLIKRIKEVTIE